MVKQTSPNEETIQAQLDRLPEEAAIQLEAAQDLASIEQVRIFFLGKKGQLSELMRQVGLLPKELRPSIGQLANTAKSRIEMLLDESIKKAKGQAESTLLSQTIDITLPGRKPLLGQRHPLIQTARLVLSTLEALGFSQVHGPEIEHDFYNFEALNMPKNHPAREMQDTFYITPDVVLRTHVSPVQIRTLFHNTQTPLRVVSLGRVFRRDQDITHSPSFFQVEGLFVDTKVSFADLKGTLSAFLKVIFTKETHIRMRPSFFPFTEPSAEVDISCFLCGQNSQTCRLCKGSGWIEILGAGMVDPEVFKQVGLDPEKVSGFAFGMGIERIAMLRHQIQDIRLFYENDLRFLEQF